MDRGRLVSVIVPYFNAQGSLERTLHSLLEQTHRELEVVLVDDCSTDESRTITARMIPLLEARDVKVNLIRHEKNQGVAVARNSGLDAASGEFIYFLDADDFIQPEAIGLMVEEARQKEADIVGCHWYLTFGQNQRKMKQPAFANREEAIEKMLSGLMRWNLWLFLVRKSLYDQHGIRFVPGMNMGEDLLVTIKLFLVAGNVSAVDRHLYHYGQSNEASLTKVYSESHRREVSANVLEVERCLASSWFAGKVGDYINFLKLSIKLPLLISNDPASYRAWLEWFPEANDQVMRNRAQPFRTRLLQQMAVKRQFWFIKIYNKWVIGFVYGILFR